MAALAWYFGNVIRSPMINERLKLFSPRMTWSTLVFLFFSVLIFPHDTGGECRIPEMWDGTWFIKEHDHGHPIIINSSTNTISRQSQNMLGNCTWSKDGFYVFRDADEACRKCILIEQKHKNILYSKEGFDCKPDKEWGREDTEENLCHDLRNDPNQSQHYWFRQNYKKIDCPFRGLSFEFSYSKPSGTCETPVSHASSCVDHTKLELRYEACHDQTDSASKAEELTCIGEWNESNHQYFVADVKPLDSRVISSYQERFRCFISREKLVPNHDNTRQATLLGYDIGTVETATCAGLRSPETAETVLFLKKETFVGPDWKPCSFPRWLSDHKWMDMGSTVEFLLPFQFKNRTIHIIPRGRQNSRDNLNGVHGRGFFPLSHSNLRCLEIANVTGESDGHIAVLAEYSVGCRIDLACLQFVRRSTYIFQLYYMPWGEMSRKQYQANCLNASMSLFHKEATMVSLRGINTPCPVRGNFSVNMAQHLHDEDSSLDPSLLQIFNSSESQWSIGCKSEETVDVEVQTSMSLKHLHCLDEWTESQVHYAVVSTGSGDGEPVEILCMVMQGSGNETVGLSYYPKAVLTTKDCIKQSGIPIPEVDDGFNGIGAWEEDVAREDGSTGYSQLELIRTGSCESSTEYDLDQEIEVSVEYDKINSSGATKLSGNVFIILLIALVIVLQCC